MPQITAYIPNLNLDLSGGGHAKWRLLCSLAHPDVGVARLWNISGSLRMDSRSLLLNTATGQPVAHWLEVDHCRLVSSLGTQMCLQQACAAMMTWVLLMTEPCSFGRQSSSTFPQLT
jgi:hypothetical protein